MKKIIADIVSQKCRGYIPQLVFSEFYYKTWQVFGEQAALIRMRSLRESVLIEYILNERDLYIVGKAKIDHPFLSLIDSIVFATSKATSSTIITSDRDFQHIKNASVKKIEY